MPAKLYSHALELAAIKSMTSGNERLANRIFSRVNEDFFSMEHTAEAFRRIQNLARKHGDLPRWNNLMEDMVISQDSRDELDSREVDPVANKREAEDLILGLDKYRKTRSLWRTTRKIQEKLKGESIDLDQLTEEMADVLNSTRGSTDMADHTTLIGGKNPDMGILREVLTNTENEFIPTGFKHFDRENQGVPRGSVFVIAATTGSGKSQLSLQIAIHQARIGAKVVVVSLEMTRVVVIRRILSHLTGIKLSVINRAHTMDQETRRLLIRTWREYHETVRKNGGRLRIVSPADDVSMSEVLATFRPYKYDNMVIDYLGLMKGLDAEDQWRKLGSAVREANRFAAAENSIVTLLAQLSPDGIVRYSRAIMEHAHLAWTWTYVDEVVRASRIITIKQPKTRNLKSFDFYLRERFDIMKMEDVEQGFRPESNNKKGNSRGRSNDGSNHDRRAAGSLGKKDEDQNFRM
jgi:replicative DNA helicase